MSNTIAILNDSYSRRVYYGQCLTNTVDQIYHANFCSYVEILQGSVDFMLSSIDFVFAKRTVGSQNYSFALKT